MSKLLGDVSAYAYAVSQGYTGTEEQFAADMARIATTASEAAASADAAAESANDAATEANTARTQAESAAASANTASGSVTLAAQQAGIAQASASEASQYMRNAESYAGAAQEAADEAETTIETVRGYASDASASKSAAATSASNAAASATAAQTAQTAAETAQGAAEDAQAAAEAAAASIDPDTLVKKTELEDYAKIDGSYETMTVGNAEQLVATVGVDDSTPYNFRTSGGSVDIGDRETVNEIVGGTIAWNQLARNGNFASKAIWNIYKADYSVSNNEATITNSDTNGSIFQNISVITGHKYIYIAYVKTGTASSVRVTFAGTVVGETTSTNYEVVSKVISVSETASRMFEISVRGTAGQTGFAKNVMLFDLTQMFSSTIADYIYSLETANAGAGVAWFKKLFPKPYYPYNAGELLSVNTSQHKMVGFNAMNGNITVGHWWSNGELRTNRTANYAAFDEKIKVVPNQTYCFAVPNITARATGYAFYYDENGNYLDGQNSTGNLQPSVAYMTFTVPSNAHYITVALYRSETVMTAAEVADACINLSWDGERDGEYEPYQEWVYPLDSSLTLRGIPKLDASNNLYYDGDTYAPDGTVTRKYGIVDLGSLTYTINNHATLGDYFYADITYISVKFGGSFQDVPSKFNAVTKKYVLASRIASSFLDKTFCFDGNADNQQVTQIQIKDSDYSDAATFKTAMNGVYLVYELATPTTESAEPYTQIQSVDDFGTEEYTDYAYENGDRDVAIPVGHNTVYSPNLRAKLEMSPNSPDGDGLYVVEQSNGQNEYVPLVIPTELPTAPSEDGTYTLKITVSGGTVTKSWIAEE